MNPWLDGSSALIPIDADNRGEDVGWMEIDMEIGKIGLTPNSDPEALESLANGYTS